MQSISNQCLSEKLQPRKNAILDTPTKTILEPIPHLASVNRLSTDRPPFLPSQRISSTSREQRKGGRTFIQEYPSSSNESFGSQEHLPES